MLISPGFYDPATNAGIETVISTPCYGAGNWAKTAGYLRLRSAGTVQVQVWACTGRGAWHNYGLTTLTRDGGCASWQLQAVDGVGGGFIVWRVRQGSDSEAVVPIDACIEEIPV